jgi:hypothetical protein
MSGADDGFFSPTGKTEGILLPVDAKIMSAVPLFNADASGWIADDATRPIVSIITQEFSNGQIHLVLSAGDPESGISSVAVFTMGIFPQMICWKELGHTEQGNIEIWADTSVVARSLEVNHKTIGQYLNSLMLYVVNSRGGWTIIPLTFTSPLPQN